MPATVWSAAKESPMEGAGEREGCYLIAVSVQMTLAGCGGVCRWTVARIAAVCVCAAAGPRGAFLHRSHNLQCPAHACTATLARQPKHRKTAAGITSPRCWIKSSLYPQKSRINMKNVNVCAAREGERERRRERERKKDILKYTFIQSLCEIKQQNWSALPSTLALLPPLNSPSHQVSTFHTGHRHDDSSLARCHLSSGQNPGYYGIGFIWLPWAKTCLEESTEPHSQALSLSYTHTHT